MEAHDNADIPEWSEIESGPRTLMKQGSNGKERRERSGTVAVTANNNIRDPKRIMPPHNNNNKSSSLFHPHDAPIV